MEKEVNVALKNGDGTTLNHVTHCYPFNRESALDPPDRELVCDARNGNVAAFTTLYERYYRLAVGLARCRLRDVHLAEDVVQEAFAIVCRDLTKLRKPEMFSQWLGTICRHTAS